MGQSSFFYINGLSPCFTVRNGGFKNEASMVAIVFYLFSAMLLLSGLMVITARNPVYSILFLIYAFFNAAGLFVILGAEFLAMMLVIVYVGAVADLFLFVVMMMDINWRSLKHSFSSVPKEFWHSFGIFIGYSAIFCASFLICVMGLLNLLGYLFEAIPQDVISQSLILFISSPKTFLTLPLWKMIQTLFQMNLFSLPSLLMIVSLFLSLWLAKVAAELILRSSFRLVAHSFVRHFPVAWFIASIFGGQLVLMATLWHDSSVTKTLIGTTQLISEPTMQNTQALGQIIYTDYLYIFQLSGVILLIAMIGAIVLTHRKRDDVKRQSIKNQLERRKEDTLQLKDAPLGKGI